MAPVTRSLVANKSDKNTCHDDIITRLFLYKTLSRTRRVNRNVSDKKFCDRLLAMIKISKIPLLIFIDKNNII